jgi:hypothetical protein
MENVNAAARPAIAANDLNRITVPPGKLKVRSHPA